MIDFSKIAVFHNDRIGIIWLPEHGKLKRTSSEHAVQIENMLKDIKSHNASRKDAEQLMEYLSDQSASGDSSFRKQEKKNLLNRDYIERLEIMVANDCNLACKYCYACSGTYQKKSRHMTPDMACSFLDALLDTRYKYINNILFFGGEPTICHETINKICEYVYGIYERGLIKKLPLFTMVTNATLTNDRIVNIIKKYDIKVTVSIDGPKDITDALRVYPSGRGAYDDIIIAVKKMQDAGIAIRMAEVTFTSLHEQMGYTHSQIKEFIQHELNINEVYISNCEENPCHPELAYEINDKKITADPLSLKLIFRRMCNHPCSGIVCESGFGSVAMMPDGTLFPCHYFVYNDDFCIAKYSKEGYDFSNYDDFLTRYRNVCHFNNPKCDSCWARYTCNMCAAGVYVHNMEACENIKKAQIAALFELAKQQ